MTAIVTRGDAGNLHLPDETVDLVVTSPPYWSLRAYQDNGETYAGQIGAEASADDYLDALMACTAEWVRVLNGSGSLFINLGDKYGPNKSLSGLPWRYAIRCIDELGLILRAEIVWAKPNGLPESVTDRVRRSHEQVFHFVKQPRYYSAVDEVREQYAPETAAKYAAGGLVSSIGTGAHPSKRNGAIAQDGDPAAWKGNPLGKLPGSVWTIPTAPLRVPESLGIDHFAAYPPELVRRIVLGWSPREVCTACGEGRRPVSNAEQVLTQKTYNGRAMTEVGREDCRSGPPRVTLRTITGYACACPDTAAPSTPGVVLDPFGGTGTTALVASVHGRIGISNDLSADYCRLAQWRTTDEKQRAKAAGVKTKAAKKAKTEPVADVIALPGQLDLTSEGEWTA